MKTERYEVINEVSDLICPVLSKIRELYEIDWFPIISDTIEIETETKTYVLVILCTIEDCRIASITISNESFIQFEDRKEPMNQEDLRKLELEMKGMYL
jgi:hypothetical protein